uniref:Uncharacterized protein n=1 Tax=Rhizophora mucronata TaxID=61149 RepID=A0A2P2PX06_RHIMU
MQMCSVHLTSKKIEKNLSTISLA